MKVNIEEITITLSRTEGEQILNTLLHLSGDNGMKLSTEICDKYPEAYKFKELLRKNFRQSQS